ncbi:MAG: glycine cleavage system aminomethyltransferase GcvT [Janthinobacterium lividum]
MTALKKTSLHATHVASGARMVDFGGWDMPVNYGSQLEEHHAVRTHAGMFDVSHMRVVDLGGAPRSFLRHALANDVQKLQTPGRALYSCLLNPAGGVIDDLIAYFFREDFFRLVVNAATAEKDIGWLRELAAATAADVTIEPREDLAIIAVQGPQARELVWQVLPEVQADSAPLRPFHAASVEVTGFGEIMVARTGYTGEDGFELIVPAAQASRLWSALAKAGVRPCGLGARDTLRLEAGMNLYGQDMDDTVSPLDAGLGWTVDLSSARDFVGRAALEAAGRQALFAGLIVRDGKGILRAHQAIVDAAGTPCGEVTSGTFSPSLRASIAFARLAPTVTLGQSVNVLVRDKPLAATVVKLPFVRNGKSLVD